QASRWLAARAIVISPNRRGRASLLHWLRLPLLSGGQGQRHDPQGSTSRWPYLQGQCQVEPHPVYLPTLPEILKADRERAVAPVWRQVPHRPIGRESSTRMEARHNGEQKAVM